MRFRHRSFRTSKGQREPVMWVRVAGRPLVQIQLTSAAPQSISAALFGGSQVDAGIDQRLTTRRIKVAVFNGGNTIVDTDLMVMCGLGLFGQGEVGTRTPLLATVADRQVDWLDLWAQPAVASQVALASIDYRYFNRDIKAMRKVDEDQNLSLSFELFRASGGGVSAAQVVNLTVAQSVLFSRTKR